MITVLCLMGFDMAKVRARAPKHITSEEIAKLREYLKHMENIRRINEEHHINLPLDVKRPNWLAIEQAKEISAWLSIYEDSVDEYWKGVAEKQLLSIVR